MSVTCFQPASVLRLLRHFTGLNCAFKDIQAPGRSLPVIKSAPSANPALPSQCFGKGFIIVVQIVITKFRISSRHLQSGEYTRHIIKAVKQSHELACGLPLQIRLVAAITRTSSSIFGRPPIRLYFRSSRKVKSIMAREA